MIGKEIEWLDGDVSSLPAVEESEEKPERRRGSARKSETDGRRSSSRSSYLKSCLQQCDAV